MPQRPPLPSWVQTAGQSVPAWPWVQQKLLLVQEAPTGTLKRTEVFPAVLLENEQREGARLCVCVLQADSKCISALPSTSLSGKVSGWLGLWSWLPCPPALPALGEWGRGFCGSPAVPALTSGHTAFPYSWRACGNRTPTLGSAWQKSLIKQTNVFPFLAPPLPAGLPRQGPGLPLELIKRQ